MPPGILPANDRLDLLYRHRSVRRFTAEAVDDQTVTAIVAAAQSAATSSNQQSWSVIEIRDPVRLARAAELAGQQDFIRDAAVFLVFVADWSRAALPRRRARDRPSRPCRPGGHVAGLHGRHTLRDALERRGLPSR